MVTATGAKTAEAKAGLPGETGGNAIQVSLDLSNGSKGPIDASEVQVSASYGPNATPAIGNTSPPAVQLHGVVPPGGKTSGVYLFRVPKGTSSILLSVSTGFSPNVVQVTT
jgi:hypothetical protein